MSKVKSTESNTSKSMGTYGAQHINAETLVTTRPISSITVLDGTVTVSGKQLAENKEFPNWSGVVFNVGTYIVPLTEVTLVASGNAIVYYA